MRDEIIPEDLTEDMTDEELRSLIRRGLENQKHLQTSVRYLLGQCTAENEIVKRAIEMLKKRNGITAND